MIYSSIVYGLLSANSYTTVKSCGY